MKEESVKNTLHSTEGKRSYTSPETTLSQLSEVSKRLLAENAEFLHSIYNDLDN